MVARYRAINPLLGVYYGIFAAAYIGLCIFLLILEYMGVIEGNIAYVLTAAAFFLTGGIAVAATTRVSDEFFVSGRRVPSGLNGLVILVVTLGGAGLSGLVGCVFFLGIDGFALMFGVLGGVMLAGVLGAAFIRKSGAYTLPSFFEIRYRSRMVGGVLALCLLVPTCFFALAELALVKQIGPMVFGVSAEYSIIIVIGAAMLFILPGGMRSMSWSQCALAIVVLLGLMIPLVLISLNLTNLPLAQLTYGSLIEDVAKFESLSGDVAGEAQFVWPSLLSGAPQPLDTSFLGGVRVFSPLDKIALFLVIVAGIAGMPALLMRASVVSNVFQARKSFAWGAALIGLLILTIPAYAIFMRYMIFDPELKILMGSLPGWVSELSAIGLFNPQDVDGNGKLTAREILLARDGVFVGLPMVAGLNKIMQSLTFAALMAAAVAGFMTRILMLGQVLARDLNPKKTEMEAEIGGVWKMISLRLIVLFVGIVLGFAVFRFSFDPFQMFLAGLLLCATCFFPAFLLSVWWRGMTQTGLILCVVSGMVLGCSLLFVTGLGAYGAPFGFSFFVAGLMAIIVSLVIGWVGAIVGAKPTEADLEMLSDIRTSGGEAIYDRILRQAMPRRSIGGN